MAKFPEVPVSAVLQLVKKHLSVGGSAKAQVCIAIDALVFLWSLVCSMCVV